MKVYEELSCMRCGYEWRSKDKDPKRCPGCGTYKWEEKPTIFHCVKCDYIWNGKRDWSPKRCPSCRSTTWKYHPEKEKQPIKPDKRARAYYQKTLTRDEIEKIIGLYEKGISCTEISLSMDVPFSMVFTVISDVLDSDVFKV